MIFILGRYLGRVNGELFGTLVFADLQSLRNSNTEKSSSKEILAFLLDGYKKYRQHTCILRNILE